MGIGSKGIQGGNLGGTTDVATIIDIDSTEAFLVRKDGDSVMIADMPRPGKVDEQGLELFEEAKEIISAVRNIRQNKNISMKDKLELQIVSDSLKYSKDYISVINKLANISSEAFVEKADDGTMNFMVKTTEYAIPVGDLIDVEAEKKRLEEDLKYQEGFMISVQKKLSNERFVNNAPEAVVNIERQKMADAEIKIKTIKEQLIKLG